MTLDGAMSANPDRVAASGSATTVPGGNTNAAALAALASQLSMAGGTRTFSSYYGELLSSLGGDAAQAYADESRSALQLSVAFDARDATSAVSLEEEAIDLIRFQEAYQAAARVVSSANALFDDLLSIVS
jgi:flagellar hook-associated protein 1 FlgK